MLDCSEVDTEVLDISMKTMGSGEYRKLSRVNRVANSVLVTMQSKAIFSCKDEWKVINLFT